MENDTPQDIQIRQQLMDIAKQVAASAQQLTDYIRSTNGTLVHIREDVSILVKEKNERDGAALQRKKVFTFSVVAIPAIISLIVHFLFPHH